VLAGAITADPLGVLVAFGAGILSFLSPCVLPLVPGYLSMVSGLSAAELGRPGRPAAVHVGEPARQPVLVGAPATAGGPPVAAGVVTGAARRRPLGPLLRGIGLFVAGFTVVFVVLGAVASGVGHLLRSHKALLTSASGGVVVALGVVMLLSSLPPGVWTRLGATVSGRVGWLVGERRFHVRTRTLGTWAAPVMGMAFACAWTPCIGPVLGAMLALASTRATLGGALLLLFVYSLGLGVPFLVTGIAFDRLTALYARARRPLAVVQLVAAAILIAFGVILLVGDLGWLSGLFRSLLDHLGLERLTTS
jgi:cytochrome c-type biogenesis protein